MQCPKCALYHPPRYQTCVGCGAKLVEASEVAAAPESGVTAGSATGGKQSGRSGNAGGPGRKRGMPVGVGLAVAGFILCASAGGTIFFLTKPPENERLYQQGQKQLQLGQYAFAVKTLSEAVKVKPNDSKALLSLARAYVGVDQVDKAWECITQAQQLGAGVVAEPQLASDLANYYRQRGEFDKALELLRPLAAADVPGKKAELADLDASYGDECIRKGDYKTAMRCWEEVKSLHDGSRFSEAESRLATIYQKLADSLTAGGDEQEALKFYTRLNASNPTPASYERTAEIYERQGKLELAIDQLEKAIKLSSGNQLLNSKLSHLMARLGKEMLDRGEADTGFAYLQKAQSLDPRVKAPVATVRSVRMQVDGTAGNVHMTGEVWNPGHEMLNSLTLRAEIVDKATSRILWTRDHRVIDEFVPPLAGRDSRSFELQATAPFDPATSEMRLYLNGSLYKAYALGKADTARAGALPVTPSSAPLTLRPRLTPPSVPAPAPVSSTNDARPHAGGPQLAPQAVTTSSAPVPAPAPGIGRPGVPGAASSSAEEKTLGDLD